MTDTNVTPVVLCGGSGTRLWPLSRESLPKQFAPLIGGRSPLAATLERVRAFGPPLCVANHEHRFLVQEALAQARVDGRQLLEPKGRNTAPAMAAAALVSDPASLLLFLPADHYVPDVEAFVATVRRGIGAAQAGYIVTFGVAPTQPSTGYGYLRKGADVSGTAAFEVAAFVEKPTAEVATRLMAVGGHYWNAGIFLTRADTLLGALRMHAPDILAACETAMARVPRHGVFLQPDRDAFLACRSESIDYAVMEKHPRVAMVPFLGAWSDVGNWNAVAELTPADPRGNRTVGSCILRDCSETYVHSHSRPVVALGTEHLVIVDTPDALLVADASRVEQVKDAVAELKERDMRQAFSHRRVARPWGTYDSIDAGDRFQVKRITVSPGASLSLQMHHRRAEHWVVVQGVAEVTRGDEKLILSENESVYIPLGAKHRLANPGTAPLELIEVQSGSYLGEDDIVRFEDSYGRN